MVDHCAHIFLASRPLLSVYSYGHWYLCTFLRWYGIPAFQTALRGFQYKLYCTDIFHIIGMFFFFFTLLLIYSIFSSFIMAPGKKPASTKAKAKAPSAKATASPCVCLQPDKAPNKKSMSVKHTSSSKPSIAATMDTSISSDSSVSSTDVGDYGVLPDVSDFVPTSLPSGHGTIPIDVKDLCQIAVLSPS
jgi:hypothetical protein